jgi:hexosaminidase
VLLRLCLQVLDAPRFIWRGVLLDVGRHFFPVPFILKVLDLLALYKLNRFHWHLVEDQVRPGKLLCWLNLP